MKSILTPIVFPESAEATVATACAVGRPFGSYVEGYYAYPIRAVMISDAMGITATISSDMDDNARATENVARDAFDAALAAHGVAPAADGAADAAMAQGMSGKWIGTDGRMQVAIGEYGRLFDLIVIGRHASQMGVVMIVGEEVLFDGGRPILLAPETAPERVGERILIVWNGGPETARTIAFGLPLLERASAIRVLTVVGATVRGPSGEQVAQHLRRRGLTVEAQTVDPGKRSPGEAILDDAAAWNADLLFKGAYTSSRLRQLIFGGPTRHIVNEATLPVFMAH